MQTLLTNIEFWKLVAGMAWPIVALVMFFFLRGQILRIFDREEMDIEVAGIKIRVRDATKQLGTQLTDLTGRVAAIESGHKPAPSNTIAHSERSFSILWVDDYPSNNAFLVDKFRLDGIGVELSLSTADALTRAAVHKFDVVISDLGRQEDGSNHPFAGLELLEALKANGFEIPTVIYAGQRGLQNEIRLKQAGALLVASSPVEVIAFVEHLRRTPKKI